MKKIFFLVVLLLAAPHVQAASYKSTLKEWTRSAVKYRSQDLIAILQMKATLLNDTMLRAQAAKNAKTYDLIPEDREGVLTDLEQKRGDAVLFFISFYSSDRKYDDLANPRCGWDLRLENKEGIFHPERIEKVNKLSPLEIMYYPYLNPWSKGYFVWFPAEAASSSTPWVLSVHGTSAHADLTWK